MKLENKKMKKKKYYYLFIEISGSSLLNCNLVIEKRREVVSANKEILNFTGPNSDWESKYKLDSLLYHVMHSGWRHVPQKEF